MSEPRRVRPSHMQPGHAIAIGRDRAQENLARRDRRRQAAVISSGKVRGGPSAESKARARARRAAGVLALPPAEAEALARNHERIEERRTRRG